ncbi:hypothetical protein Glove_606g61 [Diversispora epigaea]|uniref:Uncharacterized protein n=1 Tax=Diversispora epigaea TaxID=1348612 RepID=A0A397GD52_9GLOM|nr:hypothetical protein Glove_606g61 [Diversispora epigaea]
MQKFYHHNIHVSSNNNSNNTITETASTLLNNISSRSLDPVTNTALEPQQVAAITNTNESNPVNNEIYNNNEINDIENFLTMSQWTPVRLSYQKEKTETVGQFVHFIECKLEREPKGKTIYIANNKEDLTTATEIELRKTPDRNENLKTKTIIVKVNGLWKTAWRDIRNKLSTSGLRVSPNGITFEELKERGAYVARVINLPLGITPRELWLSLQTSGLSRCREAIIIFPSQQILEQWVGQIKDCETAKNQKERDTRRSEYAKRFGKGKENENNLRNIEREEPAIINLLEEISMRLNDLDMMNGRMDAMESHLGIDNEMEQEINQVDNENYGERRMEVKEESNQISLKSVLTSRPPSKFARKTLSSSPMLSELTNRISGMESSVSAVNNRVNTFESNIIVRRNKNGTTRETKNSRTSVGIMLDSEIAKRVYAKSELEGYGLALKLVFTGKYKTILINIYNPPVGSRWTDNIQYRKNKHMNKRIPRLWLKFQEQIFDKINDNSQSLDKIGIISKIQ